jgi:lysophospholipase L1-like esterase
MGRPSLFGILIAVLAIGCLVLGRDASTAAAAPSVASPGQYYLSLGDSGTFGYQQAKAVAEVSATGTIDPTTFNTGFTDDFYRMLGAISPHIQLVNYGCPGQTSTEFVSVSGCPSYPYPLHNGYSSTQLQAALSFLQAHPGQVNPISIFMGANDIQRQIKTCGGLQNLSCVASALPVIVQTMAKNLGQIAASLRAAAPNAQILLGGLFNPYAVADPTTDPLAVGINKAIAGVAQQTGATFVDSFAAINGSTPAAEKQRVCALTFFCTALQDIHPSDAGYAALAKTFWDASGFAQYAAGPMIVFYGTAGQGEVYFGSGPGCMGLVEVATRDLMPAGNTAHIVYITGNDLPGTVGDNGVIRGVQYSFENVTITPGGQQVDDNGGSCYTFTL